VEFMEQGREYGWEPTPDMYELFIGWMCREVPPAASTASFQHLTATRLVMEYLTQAAPRPAVLSRLPATGGPERLPARGREPQEPPGARRPERRKTGQPGAAQVYANADLSWVADLSWRHEEGWPYLRFEDLSPREQEARAAAAEARAAAAERAAELEAELLAALSAEEAAARVAGYDRPPPLGLVPEEEEEAAAEEDVDPEQWARAEAVRLAHYLLFTKFQARAPAVPGRSGCVMRLGLRARARHRGARDAPPEYGTAGRCATRRRRRRGARQGPVRPMRGQRALAGCRALVQRLYSLSARDVCGGACLHAPGIGPGGSHRAADDQARGASPAAGARRLRRDPTRAQEQGIPLEARHYNWYFKVLAREPSKGVEAVQVMMAARYGPTSRPTTETYNLMIEARRPTLSL